MNSFFISYRRQDSADACASIHSRLDAQFRWTPVFKDIDDIPGGSDFRKVIQDALQQCAVLLAVIGPQWLTVTTPNGMRRLDDPADFVRLEIETAINQGIPIVILLVHGARMLDARQLPPTLAPLAQCPAFPVRGDSFFQEDMDRVIQKILHWWPALGRWHVTYPRIAALSSLAFILVVSSLLLTRANILSLDNHSFNLSFLITAMILSVIATLLGFGCQIFTLFRLFQLRQWGWFISMLFPGGISLGLMAILFGLIGPIKPHRKTDSSISVEKVRVWHIGKQQIVALVVSSLIFFLLDYACGRLFFMRSSSSWFFQSIGGSDFLPSLYNIVTGATFAVLFFSGARFGPWVGLGVVFLGGFLGDYLSGYMATGSSPWYSYVIWPLYGFLPGLAFVLTKSHYGTRVSITRAFVIVADTILFTGLLLTIGDIIYYFRLFSSFSNLWNYPFNDFSLNTLSYIFGLLLFPIFLLVYEKISRITER